MGKESSTTLHSLKIVNDDISNLRDHGYDIDADGIEFKLYTNRGEGGGGLLVMHLFVTKGKVAK